jgi:hypothetical protein
MENRRSGGRRRKAHPDRHACDPPPEATLPTRADHLDYIAEMLCELKAMSERVDRPALTVLLELACQEAAQGRRPG